MSRDIKILYVVNALLPNERAHGIQIVNTCAGMAQAGLDVDLCSPTTLGNRPKDEIFAFYNLPKTFSHITLFAIDIPGLSVGFYIRSLTFYIAINVYILFRILQSLLQQKRLVIYVRAEAVFAVYLASFLCPVVFETHQIRNHEWMYKQILKRVKGVVVITTNLKNKFVHEYGLPTKKILVARDAVDVKKFMIQKDTATSIFTKYGIPSNKKLVIYCGSLSREKGVYVLAEAAKHLLPEFHVLIIGGQGVSLESFKKQYDGFNNISCAGYISHDEVPYYIAAAHVLIQPDLASDTYASQFTSPMKLFEYMASGRPIIASDVPSLKEVLTDASASFFHSGDSSSLAAAINRSVDTYDTLMVRAIQAKHDVAEYTWEKRGELISGHLHGIL